MAEISLKDYQAKVERLLRDEHYDEALYHCRHILKQYPKNVLTYRQLGRALAGGSRWKEAEEVFLRVLSVYPNEGGAHRGLSQVYMATKQHDKALYHMERAFEQDPTNDKLAGAYRTLYSQIHHVDNPKVPLTAAAVAQQHLKSDLYDQAIDVLRQAIQRNPERVDLRLMLAQAYWKSDQLVDAAERALDVLEKLPDCLEANKMLTELWLSQERPFDAVRYLSHLEALDPYLASELARGQAVPKNAFMLDELDYNLLAAQHMATSKPDWLQSVDAGAVVAEPAAEMPPDEVSDDGLSALLGEDVVAELPAAEPAAEEWLAEIDALKERSLEPTLDIKKGEMQKRIDAKLAEQQEAEQEESLEAASDDWLAEFGDIEPADEEERPITPSRRGKTGLTGLLTALAEAEQQEAESAPEAEPIFDEMPDLFAETPGESEAVPAEDDALGWLQDSDVDLSTDNIPARPMRDISDPLGWLQGTGVEIVEELQGTEDVFGVEEEMQLQALDKTDPLQWLQGTGVEIEQDEAQPVVTGGDEDVEKPSTDPLAWLQDSGISLEAEAEEEDILDTARLSAPTETPAAGPSGSSWLEDESLLDEMLQLESLTSGETSADMESWADSGLPDAQAVSELEWTDAMSDNEPSNWLEDSDAEKAEFDDASQLDGLEWLSQDSGEEEEPAAAEMGEMPDWLSASAPAAPEPAGEPASAPFDESAFDWADEVGEEAEAAPITSEVPDWLGGVEIDAPVVESEEDVATLDWMSNEAVPVAAEASGESFDDEQTLENSGYNWEQEEPAADMPDWLSSVGPMEEEAATEPESAAADFQWDEEQADAALVSDMPDWLSSVPVADQPAAESESFDDEQVEEWMADEEEPAVIGEQPDWLSGVSVEEEPVAEAAADTFGATELDWSAEVAADEEEPAIMGEQPDWLSGVSVEEEPVAEAAADTFGATELDWSAGVAADEEEPAIIGDQPDWQSGVSAEEEPVTGAESEPFAEPELDWSAEVTADEEEPAIMGEQPDWLSGVSVEEEPVTGAESEPFAEPELDWSAEVDEEEPAIMGEQPDWLSGVSVEEEPVAESESEWGAEIDTEEAEPVQPAAEVPDWLSGVRVEEEPTTEARSVEPDWLSGIGAVEEPAEAVSEQPEWLSGISMEEEPVPQAVSDYDDEEAALDWMAEVDEDAVAPQSDVPEWLGGVEPGEEEAEPVYDMYGEEAVYDEEPAIADVPDWLGSIKAQQQADYDPELEKAPGIGAELSWLSDVDEARPAAQVVADGEYEPAPAENAPDWLNAMVPGLDVDYDAPEDAPVEQEYLQGPSHRARADAAEKPETEFGWLTEIVDEETAAVPVAQAASKRRFSFSRLPIWLRKTAPLGAAVQSAKPTAQDIPAWLADAPEPADVDDDDFDLPDDWLK